MCVLLLKKVTRMQVIKTRISNALACVRVWCMFSSHSFVRDIVGCVPPTYLFFALFSTQIFSFSMLNKKNIKVRQKYPKVQRVRAEIQRFVSVLREESNIETHNAYWYVNKNVCVTNFFFFLKKEVDVSVCIRFSKNFKYNICNAHP